VNSFLESQIIPSLLRILESVSSIAITSSFTEDVASIHKYICGCFVCCTCFSYEQTAVVVNCGVIKSLLSVLEELIDQIKSNGRKFNEVVVKNSSMVLSNITSKGFKKTGDGEKNYFRNNFDKVDGINRLFEIFNYLQTQENQSQLEKETVDRISLSICRLFKSDTPPSYGSVLVYVNKLKSSPSPTSGFDFPLKARKAWEKMINADKCLETFKK
jgi:hypothetical protein